MHFIGCASQLQNGKDTLCNYLQKRLNAQKIHGVRWARESFGYNVKKVFCDAFDVTMEFLEEWKVRDEAPPGFDKNVRKSLQFIGDGFRQINPYVWIDPLFVVRNPKIVSDQRYLNEVMRGHKERGCNLLLGRTAKLNNDPNGSEAELRPYIEWCLKNVQGDYAFIKDLEIPEHLPDLKYFHVFIRNDKEVSDLYRIIDEVLVPYIKTFDFGA